MSEQKYAFLKASEVDVIKNKMAELRSDHNTQFGVVVDLETFGKKSNCMVFNLGGHVFSFDPRKMDEIPLGELDISKNYHLTINDQGKHGREIEDQTWEWWCKPENQGAMQEIMKLPSTPFVEGVRDFDTWLTAVKKTLKCRVWYRGQDFDHPILESMFKDVGRSKEFVRGSAPRDVRSYIDAATGGNTGFIPGYEPVTELHTALGDCINDIRQMQMAWCLINNVDMDFVKAY